MATNNLAQHETEVANAIRTVKGTTAKINPQDFAKEILSMSSGGGSIKPKEVSITINHQDTYEFWDGESTSGVYVFDNIQAQDIAGRATFQMSQSSPYFDLSFYGIKWTLIVAQLNHYLSVVMAVPSDNDVPSYGSKYIYATDQEQRMLYLLWEGDSSGSITLKGYYYGE